MQGDVLSPALFDVGLEVAMSSWKRRPTNQGVKLGEQERLKNARYADDFLSYAKSLPELRQSSSHG